jgi:hypothetical protein
MRTYLIRLLSAILKWLEKKEIKAREKRKSKPFTERHLFSIGDTKYIALEVLRPGLLVDILAHGLQLDLSEKILWTSSFMYQAGYVAKNTFRFPEADIQSLLEESGVTMRNYDVRTCTQRYNLPKELSSSEGGVLTRVAYVFLDHDGPYQLQREIAKPTETLFLASYGKGSIIFALQP